MNHETLRALTADRPCKIIEVGGLPYLERYYMGHSESGGMWMLHHFLREDSEPHLHTHPWTARVIVLCGGYTEELLQHAGWLKKHAHYKAGDTRMLFPHTLHRIVSVQPDTWTLLHVEPGRLPTWSFIADDGTETVVQSSPENWHESCGPRK
jgi:hypothetical protein